MTAAATKAKFTQLAVDAFCDCCIGVDEKGSGLLVFQIAAGVGGGGEKFNSGKLVHQCNVVDCK